MKNCWNCKYYEEKEESEYYTIYGYCKLYDCDLCEIAGLNPFYGDECFQEVEK